MKILIVDDEKDLVEMLRERLIYKRHSVDATYNGLKALDLINTREYDIALIDHNMPEMTGLELIKQMKAKGLKTKIVMITEYKELPEVGARAIGADEYIAKPIEIKKLEAIVAKYAKGI